MTVTYVVRFDAGLYRGGGEIQAERTAAAMRARGVEVVDFQPTQSDLGDLVHFFGNFDYFDEIASHCRKRGVPYVASPIFVTPRTQGRLKWRSTRQRTLGQFPKGSARLLSGAKALFTLTKHEEESIRAYFGEDLPSFVRIPNGVEARFTQGDPQRFRERFGIAEPFAIQTATIDKSKNQLTSIRAIGNRQLVLMGRESDPEYARRCRAEAGSNVHFLGSFPHEDPALADALAAAHVFLLPSYRELFPLSALEATGAGCRLLLSDRWNGQEIWADDAKFLDPDVLGEWTTAVEEAFNLERPPAEISRNYLKRYSWDAVAERLEAEYRRALGN